MLIDSHCHLDQLDLTAYEGSLDAALAQAKENKVTHFLCVCIDLNNFPAVLKIAEKYPNIKASVGIHPNEVLTDEPSFERLVNLADHPEIVAIGETGLDYFRTEGDLTWQRDRFARHIQVAKTTKKPLIIHMRDATEDTLKIIVKEDAPAIGGVLHCFTDTLETALKLIDLNFYISISGIVTFKNALELKKVAKEIPLERMLIETDSPYLAPMPYRGKPNEPAYVRYVAEHIAELRGISVEEVGEATSRNFFNLFGGEFP